MLKMSGYSNPSYHVATGRVIDFLRVVGGR